MNGSTVICSNRMNACPMKEKGAASSPRNRTVAMPATRPIRTLVERLISRLPWESLVCNAGLERALAGPHDGRSRSDILRRPTPPARAELH